MNCIKCGYPNNVDSQFCIKCGQPLPAHVPSNAHGSRMPLKRKRRLMLLMTISALLLAAIIMVVMLSANPVAGRWYAQNGTELIMLKNGKGMITTDNTGEAHRAHFMYAIEYQEPGYIEGELYEKESGRSSWFYLYDGSLEVNGQYFYRQKPSQPMK